MYLIVSFPHYPMVVLVVMVWGMTEMMVVMMVAEMVEKMGTMMVAMKVAYNNNKICFLKM